MNEDDYKNDGLDFEKMNSVLANPQFANWYYSEFMLKQNNISIDEFVNIINSYNADDFKN